MQFFVVVKVSKCLALLTFLSEQHCKPMFLHQQLERTATPLCQMRKVRSGAFLMFESIKMPSKYFWCLEAEGLNHGSDTSATLDSPQEVLAHTYTN